MELYGSLAAPLESRRSDKDVAGIRSRLARAVGSSLHHGRPDLTSVQRHREDHIGLRAPDRIQVEPPAQLPPHLRRLRRIELQLVLPPGLTAVQHPERHAQRNPPQITR